MHERYEQGKTADKPYFIFSLSLLAVFFKDLTCFILCRKGGDIECVSLVRFVIVRGIGARYVRGRHVVAPITEP